MRTSGKREADKQVTAHVGVIERPVFEAYAQAFGLDAGNLLHILWQRELRLERLDRIDERFQDPVAAGHLNGLDSKVTAHLADPGLKPRIKQRAEAVGLKVSRASATLLREEMSGRWLETALDLNDSN